MFFGYEGFIRKITHKAVQNKKNYEILLKMYVGTYETSSLINVNSNVYQRFVCYFS